MPQPRTRAARVGALAVLSIATALTVAASSQAQPLADAAYPQQQAVRESPATLTADPRLISSEPLPAPPASVRLHASAPGGRHAVLAEGRLQEWRNAAWHPLALRGSHDAWDAAAVTTLAWDGTGRLWFGSRYGVGVREADGTWRFIDPARGLPMLDITAMAGTVDGSMWIGTRRGAIRIANDGSIEYRQGRRWLPHDEVRAIVVDAQGTAWFDTPGGRGGIAARPITLARKAATFEADIDRYHRRTPFGYVVEAHLRTAGDATTAFTTDNDNDGLWTGMYGAAQAFAYGATRSEAARARARRAFEALRFLVDVTKGGRHAPPDGFPARSIRPTSGADPNVEYSPASDRKKQARDAFWKVLSPRWPTSADGQWYWKADTSSDELDGHYFFYALYHDLVARDDAERAEVAAVVRRITDHLLSHDYALVDHDGTPTRWAVFGPTALNLNQRWADERGLNSLSMLTYLRVAHHVTKDPRYQHVARELIERHGYAVNLLYPKYTLGVGGGNQSDDEMAFMNYYHLLKYETDPLVKAIAARSLHAYWQLERPERNPFFNVLAAVSLEGLTYTTPFGVEALSLPAAEWRDDTLDTLRRFPLDLVDHGLQNSHRLDIEPLPAHVRGREEAAGVLRRNGKVLPVDERMVFHWNVDPYALDYPGTGTRLADGTSFLLSYYMAAYHKVIAIGGNSGAGPSN